MSPYFRLNPTKRLSRAQNTSTEERAFTASQTRSGLPHTQGHHVNTQLIIALDCAAQHATTRVYLQHLVALRNWIQHCPLLLPTDRGLLQESDLSCSLPSVGLDTRTSSTTSQSSTYPCSCPCTLSLCLTSLLILSTFIIFPMPISLGLKTRLNETVLTQLDCCIMHDDWTASTMDATGHAKLIVWASMFGAINCGVAATAMEAEQKAKFIAYLASSSILAEIGMPASYAHDYIVAGALTGKQATGKDEEENSEDDSSDSSWEKLRGVLSGFIWYDSALGALARQVWRDVTLL